MSGNADQFDEVARIAPLVDDWLRETRRPRHPAQLIELLDGVTLVPDAVGLDIGAYAGAWSRAIAEAKACRMIAIDVVFHPLRTVPDGVLAVNGDACSLSLRDRSVDLVWCRDTLSMVADADAAISEMARVTRVGGTLVLYTALPTARLEPLERDELVRDLALPAWWLAGSGAVRAALDASSFTVVHEERYSPEFQESQLLERNDELLHDLVVRARLERASGELERKVTRQWARRFRAWADWPLYLLLGKLETRAWVAVRHETRS